MCGFHSLIVWSLLPEARRLPEGAIWTHARPRVWPDRTRRTSPVLTSQSLMSESPEAETRVDLCSWIALTGPRWPARTRTSSPVARDQTRIVVSYAME